MNVFSMRRPACSRKAVAGARLVPALLLAATTALLPSSACAGRAASARLSPGPSQAPLGNRYLLLVNTAVARLLHPQDLAEFDRSPYDGLAIAFHYNYDTAPVASAESMVQQLNEWKSSTRKHLWPWIFLNRLVGAGEAATNERVNVEYFKKIRGIDLEDRSGARSDFLLMLRNAVRAARLSSAPGIVLDLEFYNDHQEYDPAEMAAKTGRPASQLVGLLRELGAAIADEASREYPQAVLWLPFTGFSHHDFRKIAGASYFPTPVYIASGLLDRIKERGYRLSVVSGGEGSLGYCHENLADFENAIRKRAQVFDSVLKQYPAVLELAGTLTLWNERSGKSGFIAEDVCGKSSAATVEELEPYLELLFRSYRYNWIYGSSNGSYFAFDSHSAPRFNRVISRALENTAAKVPKSGSASQPLQ
jgi:hypothetical protein